MHPQVMQDKPGNCPICGMKLTPIRQEATRAETAGKAETAGQERKILYYWDPMMNPPYVSDKPGKSPMGMDLVPIYEDEVRGGPTVTIDPVVTQNMGLRVASVTRGPLATTLRTVGYFRAAEPNQYDVTLKVAGFVERLYANAEGMLVRKGAPLLDLYSPDLLVAQEELLAAKRALEKLAEDADPDLRAESQALVDNARGKLELWGVATGDIDALLGLRKVSQTVTFRSPATGFITEKDVVQGSAIDAGQRLFRIVDQSVVWLDAQIYASQLSLVKLGERGIARVQGLAQDSVSGEVIFINSQLDPDTRTIIARIAFPNPDLALKPGMYATVEIGVDIGQDVVQIPREAVIDTGRRQIVFVALGGGRFDPRSVKTGIETTDGTIQILEGLAPGETVVTSGQFLLDTESRTREAIQKLTAERLLEPAGAPAAGTEAALNSQGAAAARETDTEITRKTDAIIIAYLDMARALAGDGAVGSSSIQALTEAAQALAGRVGAVELEPIAQGILAGSLAMDAPSVADERRQFRALSESVIHLVDHVTPSKAVGSKLYVVHCSMYPGDWLQVEERIANPFYGSSMLECGQISRTIETGETGAAK